MDKLFSDLKTFFKQDECVVDGLVFRLHYRYTLVVLIACSITVTSRQYIGDPIDCISKDDIPTELLDTYCWIHSTFSLEDAWFKKVGAEVPYPGVDQTAQSKGRRVYHAYYQWVCFVLFLQALLFYAPRYLWKSIESRRVQALVMDMRSPMSDAKNKPQLLATYLKENLNQHSFFGSVYFTCEFLALVNVVGQLFLMDTFLGGEFIKYGLEVIAFTEWDWRLRYDPMLRVFPRMAKCTFHRYGSSGDVQKHDALCLLPINILNEKIYVFLWFWFVVLTAVTIAQLLLRLCEWRFFGIRFFLLHHQCRRIDEDKLKRVLEAGDVHDWFVLTLLHKNMNIKHFESVIDEMAKMLSDTRPEKTPQTQPEKSLN